MVRSKYDEVQDSLRPPGYAPASNGAYHRVNTCKTYINTGKNCFSTQILEKCMIINVFLIKFVFEKFISQNMLV